MKKLLFCLLACTALAGHATETSIINYETELQSDTKTSSQSRADAGYEIKFCGKLARWESFQVEYDIVQYIYVTPELATQLAGNKITSIGYAPCLGGPDTPATTKGSIFISEDMQADPIYSMNVNIENSYGRPAGYYQEGSFTRSKQYVIKENTGFYFGFKMHCMTNDYPIAVDGNAGGEFAGMIDVYSDGKYKFTYDVAKEQNANLILYARTQGAASGVENAFTIGNSRFASFSEPIFNNAEPIWPEVYISNKGNNALTTMSYDYAFDNGEKGTATVDINIPANAEGYYQIPINHYPTGRHSVTITINSINGQSAGGTKVGASFFNLGDVDGFRRKLVVEEGTGTWCGYCPIGIYAFEYLEENYPDDFIGIAVHNGDAFQVVAYQPLISKFFPGLPACIINRDPNYNLSPYFETLDSKFKEWKTQKSHGFVDFTVSTDKNYLYLNSTSTFAIDDPGKNYQIAFVVTEDGLTGMQSNYYSGTTDSSLDFKGWENYNSVVPWEFTHTAKAITDCWGATDTSISNVVAGQEYTASAKLPLSCISKNNETGERNLDKAYAIALLIDAETGIIVNAYKKSLRDASNGIESITSENESETYYNIQGMKVEQPVHGQLYIKVKGHQSSKVIY